VGAALVIGTVVTGWLDASTSEIFTGSLQAPSSLVNAVSDGRIEQIVAQEGTAVDAGDTIALLFSEARERELAVKRHELASLEVELEQARATAEVDLAWRLKSIEAESLDTRLKSAEFLRQQFDRQMEQQAWREVLDRSSLTVSGASAGLLRPLIGYDLVSPDEPYARLLLKHESARNAVEIAGVQRRLCETRLKVLEEVAAGLTAKIEQASGVTVAAARLAEAGRELALLEQQPAYTPLNAASHGIVGVYRKEKGDAVRRGEPIVTILDDDQRFVRVRIPSRRLTRFAAGAEVMLEFPAGLRRTGTTRRIPAQTTDSESDPADAFVTLRIDPKDRLWPDVPYGTAVNVRPVRQGGLVP
jgi:multidrug resistance efflux pump